MSLPRACSSSRVAPRRNTTSAEAGRAHSGKIAITPPLVQADEHLHRCAVYIDLNMVRAVVVNHPAQWKESGFREIQKPPKRYAIIDLQSLSELSGFGDLQELQRAHREWVEQVLVSGRCLRDHRWLEAIAVGSRSFVENMKNELGSKAAHRDVIEADGTYALQESAEASGVEFDR